MLEIRVADDGGTASETTNRIAGVLREDGSAPAARTLVRLVRSDFNPLADSLPGSLMDTTDENGRFGFTNPVSGSYRLEAANAAKGLYGLQEEMRYAGGNLKMPDVNLGPPAYLAIVLPDSLRTAGGYVFIPGSTFRKGIGEGRASLLGPLPAMKIPVLAYSRDAGGPWKILARNIRLRSGDTAKLQMQASDTGTLSPDPTRTWKVRLNTTVAGAAVGEDVIGFPLLVRLDSANFDFQSVPEGGAGIGFFKPDGTPLPFEIERWDHIGRRAELWVRADTLKGESDSQFLELRYSPKAQAASSDGPSVFAPADGFVGVWHLGGAPGDRPDATGNGHWAKPVYATGLETSEGQVGRADSLGIINNYLDVGIVNLGNSFTLSAWVRPDPGSYWSAVVQKAASAYDSSSDTAIAPWRLSYGLLQYGAGDSVGSTISNGTDHPVLTASAGAGPWSLLTAAFDGDRLVLYRDGYRMASNQPQLAGSLKQNEITTRIGGYTLPRSIANGSLFSGLVDEVRIENIARSEAWIKLCHENQKTGQTLIRLVR